MFLRGARSPGWKPIPGPNIEMLETDGEGEQLNVSMSSHLMMDCHTFPMIGIQGGRSLL